MGAHTTITAIASLAFGVAMGAAAEPVREDGSVLPADFGGPFELVVGPCVEGDCQIAIAVAEDNQEIAIEPLDWTCAPGPLERQAVSPFDGLGNPVRPDRQAVAWRIGAADFACVVSARLLPGPDGHDALLVAQRVGFDHLKRRQYFLVWDGGDLARLETWVEGAGPVWSWVEAIETEGEDFQIIRYLGFFPDLAGQADEVEITILAWQPGAGVLAAPPSALRAPVYAAVAADFSVIEEARLAQSTILACSDAFWVLPTGPITGVADRRFALAAIVSSRELANAALAEAAACSFDDGRVVPY